ncbi:MAG: guanylate kinase [Planctomycetaceae bacterium]|nr:MAG: guanylate kinase [Planctomycetaceae bacterium]
MALIDDLPSLRFVVLSGPSGSGKTTIVDRLLAACPGKLVKSVSATTRAPRPHEIDGRDYHFLTKEEFARRRLADDFVECAEVHSSGNWYGTLKSELMRAARMQGCALLEIDVQGARQIMERYPGALTIFVKTVDGDYEKRLRARGTESEEVIQKRLETARRELAMASSYRHQVVNDDLARAVREIICYIQDWEKERHD